MTSSTQIHLPSIMQIGGGAIQQLPDVLRNIGCKKPCIVTDKTMVTLGFVEQIKNTLVTQGMDVAIFSDVMPEPDDNSIIAGVKTITAQNFDGLIALGGGSAIDSAKAIALLASHGGNMRDYKVPYVVRQQSIPVVAIPTTAGTGSECTRVTIVSDSSSAEKMLCMGPGLMPKAAIVDYELTLTAPFRIAADTGIDALTHAIEAYVSQKANLFSQQHAISAMKLIAPNLVLACKQPDNTSAKEALMLGSSMAGIAFSNASVALVHGMSRPLGVHFHVPHGLSNAMLLPAVTEYSLSSAATQYAECAQHMGLVTNVQDSKVCHTKLINFLSDLNAQLKVPSMSEFGIHQDDYMRLIDTMAEQAIASGSPANNPRVPSPEEIKRLYQQVYR